MPEKLDGNKMALTHRITAVAMAYFDACGFKPVETEVCIASGWIADIASFVYPTPTEAKKLRLNHRFGNDPNYNWYDDLHSRYGYMYTGIVEVKVTRSDFLKDLETKFNNSPPAHLAFIAFPTGMIEEREIPIGWMGLKCSKDGSKLVKRVGWGKVHPRHPGDTIDFIAQVAIRRDHRTRYEFMRSLMRAYRATEKEGRKTYKLSSVIQVIASWVKGGAYKSHFPNLKEALESQNIKCPGYIENDLKLIESLKYEKEAPC